MHIFSPNGIQSLVYLILQPTAAKQLLRVSLMQASADHEQPRSLLEKFISTARDQRHIEDFVLECGYEKWTYGDLDCISTGLAIEMHNTFGLCPIVASLSPNHPYLLAIMLATWKLGGIFAPLDAHSPPEMISEMLKTIKPTCTVTSGQDGLAMKIMQELRIPTMPIDPWATTMTNLSQRFLHESPGLPSSSFPSPNPSSISLYLHTSSASSISNLKCVSISHETIFKGSQSRYSWWRHTWPSESFEKLRVLGWAPWSHLMGVLNDIGAAAFFSGGCYVFGVLPSNYSTENTLEGVGTSIMMPARDLDLFDRLLDSAMRLQPDIFSCVPWVLEGIQEKHTSLLLRGFSEEASRVCQALSAMKTIGCGGAAISAESAAWAFENNITLSSDFGMTELGRPLFSAKIDPFNPVDFGWLICECLIDDAKLTLVDDDGNENKHVGELVVSSHFIGGGYLACDHLGFSMGPDGETTFKTGDIYETTSNGRLRWKGRKEDYIQMASSETLDPRPIEKALNACPAIAHSCICGNNFLRRSSNFICAFIQPSLNNSTVGPADIATITRAVAAVNRTLPPPLRITWSRVVILEQGITIPYTTKGSVFRKRLESIFGHYIPRLEDLKLNAKDSTAVRRESAAGPSPGLGHTGMPAAPGRLWKEEDVVKVIERSVANALAIGRDLLRANRDTPFAELGMDSNMAVRIVNDLNTTFKLRLPLNTCHTCIDVTMLLHAILVELEVEETSSSFMFEVPPEVQGVRPGVEEIVIVGQALRLPGDINTPETFWDALVKKRDDIMTNVPHDRWDHASFYRPTSSDAPHQGGDIIFEKAGFVNVTDFDNVFFGISSPEAELVDPAIRLTLETAFDALENACIPTSKIKGSNMGVFVAASTSEGFHHLLLHERGFGAYSRFYGTGVAMSTACGRLSYLLDVHGPSVTLDTACSSGLVAFDQAVKYLQSGDGESAIVAAVNTHLWPGSFSFLSAQKMASSHSRCATFTTEADGYVPSEGCVAFVLKTKNAALRDGDIVLATVKSTAVMHGGRSQGLVAPNIHAQIALQRSLLTKADLQPSDIDFLETHGTGTSLGDLIEIQGINEVFRQSHLDRPLILGAAKSCIGHTEIAAGLVGTLKTIASLQHSAVPGLLHLTDENTNPSFDCQVVPIQIPQSVVPLAPKRRGDPYYGLVLANGFAGTMAGVILEGSTSSASKPAKASLIKPTQRSAYVLFVVSAKTTAALKQYLVDYLVFCRKVPPTLLHSVCYTACVGRQHYRYRFATVVLSMDELIRNLDARLMADFDDASVPCPGGIAFAFPGQGSQFQGMASDLSTHYPTFKKILLTASEAATKQSGYPITSFLLDSETSSDVTINDSQVTQICVFVYQYSLSKWLRNLGIAPSAVFGHSLGELTAAVVAGSLGFELALDLVITRAKLLRSEANRPGGMAIINASEGRIAGLIKDLNLSNQLVIAVYNGPNSHVVSGEMKAVEVFLAEAKSNAIRAKILPVGQGFHAPTISSGLSALREWADQQHSQMSALRIPLYSTASGKKISRNSCLDQHHWVNHARDPVRFYDALQAVDSTTSIGVVLDMGPQPLVWMALQSLEHRKIALATSTKAIGDQNKAFLTSIAHLFEYGVTPDLSRVFSKLLDATKIQVPTYPFQRQRHYPTYIPSRSNPGIQSNITHGLSVTKDVPFPINPHLYDLLEHHKIEGRRVVPGATLVDFFAGLSHTRSVKKITFNAPLVLESPEVIAISDFDGDVHFSLRKVDATSSKICSGTLATASNLSGPPRIPSEHHTSPHVMDTDVVYSHFRSVDFGLPFRNIQEIRFYPSHADAIISIEFARTPADDRTRKLDSCFHMFGAIAIDQLPQIRKHEGAFLPAALEDFTLHSQSIPDTFICRYRLPVDTARNYHVASSSFEVLSLSGELILSCRKYTVAWIPTGLVVQDKETPSTRSHSPWFQQSWLPVPISAPSHWMFPTTHLFDNILIVSSHTSRFHGVFSDIATNKTYLTLAEDKRDIATADDSFYNYAKEVIKQFQGDELAVVLDISSLQVLPSSAMFPAYYRRVIVLLQTLMNFKVTINDFVVISHKSVGEYEDSKEPFPTIDHIAPPNVGSIIQGILRVFRRETAQDDVVWALDLPSLDEVSDEDLRSVVFGEVSARKYTPMKHRTVVYRHRKDNNWCRVVPVLRKLDDVERPCKLGGLTLIVGMGSIGGALATVLSSRDVLSSRVIFIGRRPSDDSVVVNELKRQQTEGNDRCSYIQADVCYIESLRTAIHQIQCLYGGIENIIHTAAVIEDATIPNVDFASFDRVLDPKARGAWNLHIVSQELCTSLKTFVLLSSISVSLGNPGQASYVAGNLYMEALAAYRHSQNLPGVCIQLGAWESKVIQEVDLSQGFVRSLDNETGIPLILKAMTTPHAVQVIADLDFDKLASISAYSNDPLFHDIIPNDSQVPIPRKAVTSKENLLNTIAGALRSVLELGPLEDIQLGEPLTACGIDSISFAQIRGLILKELNVEVPTTYLSDTYSVRDMVTYVQEKLRVL